MTSFYLLIGIILFIILLYCSLYLINRKSLYKSWNKAIAIYCDEQNENDHVSKYIPSLQSAWICQNESVRQTHINIVLLHEEINNKINEYFRVMEECVEDTSGFTSRGGTRYLPFISNGNINSLANNFNLAKLKTDAFNLGLLVIEPGATGSWQEHTSRGVYRYHYGLKTPKKGEYGLYIKDNPIHRIKWKERQGFIWDPSLTHSVFNQTDEICFILVADIPRHLPVLYSMVNTIIHTYFPP